MKNTLLLLSLLVLGQLATGPGTGAAPALAGDPAASDSSTPEAPTLISAEDFLLADHYDKVVVMDFWASWCEPCAQALPWLAGLQERLGDQGLQIIMINVDRDPKAALPMAAQLPPTVVQVSDPKGNLAAEYKLEGLPSTFLFTRQGDPAGSHVGFQAKDMAEREAEIQALLQKGSEDEHGF